MSFPKYPRYKDSGIEWLGEVPEHWKVVKFKWLFNSASGSTPDTGQFDKYYNGTIPWIRTTDLNNGEILAAEVFVTPQALQDTACKVLPRNSVLIAMYGGDGTIGKHAILRACFRSSLKLGELA